MLLNPGGSVELLLLQSELSLVSELLSLLNLLHERHNGLREVTYLPSLLRELLTQSTVHASRLCAFAVWTSTGAVRYRGTRACPASTAAA